jgi:transposase
MPKELTAVYQIKEILRLGLSRSLPQLAIAQHCGVAKSTVWDVVKRAKAAGLTLETVSTLSDDEVWSKLGKSKPGPRKPSKREPDYAAIREALNRKGMTLRWQWEQYYEADPATALRYTQFCEHYGRFEQRTDVRMRFEYPAGERAFIDYAGPTVPVYDRATGEVAFEAQVFVAVLAASGFTYAEATRTQTLHDWLSSHVRLFRYWGGAPLILVPDNPKAAVTKAHPKRPVLNRSYGEMAAHYGAVVEPARPMKPRDKALVEQAVQGVERWVLTYLSQERFFDLAVLNARMRELVDAYNDRAYSDREGTRRSWFESYEKAALLALPPQEYNVAEWRRLTINTDYHVRLDGKYYSAPYRLARREADVKVTGFTVEIYVDGQRVASHARIHESRRKCSTQQEHMHPDHVAWGGWTTERLSEWARRIGPDAEAYIISFIAARRVPVQAFGGARGVLSLQRDYGPERLNAACALALKHKRFSMGDVESLLKRDVVAAPPKQPALALPQDHPNVRGEDYYQ